MAHEAAKILFDQRLLTQRWVIREAMSAEVLPEGYCSIEPDVEKMGQRSLLPQYLHQDVDGHILTKDWTVWLFLAMTQLAQGPEVVNWYWWMACTIFVAEGTFIQAMCEHPLPTLEGICYIPQRMQMLASGFSTNNLVKHFIKCRLKPLDTQTLFRDFAVHYLAHVSLATEPDWSRVPFPPVLELRWSVKERLRWRKKGLRGPCMEPQPAEAQVDQRARVSPHTNHKHTDT